MKNTEQILKTVQAFMGAMRDGDMRGVVANLQAAMEYQAEELRIYREKYQEATGKKRPELTDDEKRRLAGKARTLNQQLLGMIDASWSPGTVMGWYQTLIAHKYDSTGPGQKRRGRPPVTRELEDAIVEIARQNASWGYKRIQHYLNYLGFIVSFMTVKQVMNRHGLFQLNGRRNSDFNLFYDAHRDIVAACDFHYCPVKITGQWWICLLNMSLPEHMKMLAILGKLKGGIKRFLPVRLIFSTFVNA